MIRETSSMSSIRLACTRAVRSMAASPLRKKEWGQARDFAIFGDRAR
jgi:hypothetical protein